MNKIKSIDFGFLSPKMIKEMGAVKIEHAELYDSDGYPIDGGLCDLRLGVVDPGLRCRTCGNSIGQCLGHFGYIELTKPVIHPLYGKKIHMLLRATCNKCFRVLATDEELKEIKGNKLVELYKKKKKICPHCGEKQEEITFSKPTTFREGKSILTSEEIRQRLEQITDEDLKILKVRGGRPEWFVLTILPIPPVTVRPSITLETGERSEDDLTHKLVDIVRINERLRKNLELGAPDFIIADIWELLQYHISTYMDNEISTLPPARHRSGRALRTIIQRLSKKEGRFRGNLSGKRVNFSARTVISPDPRISLNEVGIPITIAKDLTVPTKVNKNNIEELRKIILNGSDKHPGANYICRPDGIRKKITEENKDIIASEITTGYIVERHLRNGDIVIINRQPSLHRMSIMCHKAKIMPGKTIRINLTATIPYNADFDGDEMNLHVPQTEEAQTEAKMLMLAENNIRSPRYGLPIITCKHDHITGCYLLTKKNTRLTKREAVELLTAIGMKIPENLKEYYTGKEIFSMLLPEDLNIEFKSSTCQGCAECRKSECPYDSYVIIEKGILKKGVIDDHALGENKAKLIDIIQQRYGNEITRKFIDNVSKISLEFISKKGFSISMDDEEISKSADSKIRQLIKQYEDQIKKMVSRYNPKNIKDVSAAKFNLETKILQMGGELSNKVGKIIKNDLKNNSAVIMAKTGARGSFVNLTQICGLIGQESIEGRRISRGFTQRTTSHFKKLDVGLKSHGFVSSGYKKGLDPIEFFFDAMNSRENLMDKSLHTRQSGYMERRLINALQDLHVKYDGTVRDSSNRVVQFLAGEDGIDPAKSDKGKINIKNIL